MSGTRVGTVARYAHAEVDLGDRSCIYSDGVPEALDGELESFTKEHLIAVWREERSHDLRTATENLLRAVAQWCGMSGPKDDVSILGLEVA